MIEIPDFTATYLEVSAEATCMTRYRSRSIDQEKALRIKASHIVQ